MKLNKIIFKKLHIYYTNNLLLVLTLIFFSNSSLSEEQNINEVQRLKDQIKNTKENFSAQDAERAALKTRLREMEKQIQQLLKENDENDAKIKDLKKQFPEQSN